MPLPDPFRIIAHRGASGYAPENTMAAFHKALEMGVSEVETDVHFSRDRHLVLTHDHTLDRTTDGQGRPGDLDLAQLKALDAGAWADPHTHADLVWERDFTGERLITLDELLDEFDDEFTYHVELKDPESCVAEAVAEAIQDAGLASRTFVTGFERSDDLLRARDAAPELRTTPLIPPRHDATEAIVACAEAGHDGISLHIESVTPDLVADAHTRGLEIRCWGVKSRDTMASGAACGVNGMTINWPDWLQEWVDSQETQD